MKELVLHGVFPELLCLFNVSFLTGFVGVLSSVVSSESFGIGTMLIQYYAYTVFLLWVWSVFAG